MNRNILTVITGTIRGLAGAAILAATLAGIWTSAGHGEPAQALVATALGIDGNTTGNTATSLGAADTCRQISSAGTFFDVDVTVSDVSDLLSWEGYLRYDPAVVKITGVNVLMFQNAQPLSDVFDASDSAPDTDGMFRISAADQSIEFPTPGDSGTGVLARVSLQALANGVSTLTIGPIDLNADTELDSPWLKNSSGGFIQDTNADSVFEGIVSNAVVIVGSTAGLTDTDGDTVVDACDDDDDNDTRLDVNDNCPLVANPSQANFDGDALGDACDNEKDGDGWTTADELYIFSTADSAIDLNPCGTDGWAPDMVNDILTPNGVSILDIADYVDPFRYFDTSVSQYPMGGKTQANAKRHDIMPGDVFNLGADINILDLSIMVTRTPTMLNGERVFNSTCPYPP